MPKILSRNLARQRPESTSGEQPEAWCPTINPTMPRPKTDTETNGSGSFDPQHITSPIVRRINSTWLFLKFSGRDADGPLGEYFPRESGEDNAWTQPQIDQSPKSCRPKNRRNGTTDVTACDGVTGLGLGHRCRHRPTRILTAGSFLVLTPPSWVEIGGS